MTKPVAQVRDHRRRKPRTGALFERLSDKHKATGGYETMVLAALHAAGLPRARSTRAGRSTGVSATSLISSNLRLRKFPQAQEGRDNQTSIRRDYSRGAGVWGGKSESDRVEKRGWRRAEIFSKGSVQLSYYSAVAPAYKRPVSANMSRMMRASTNGGSRGLAPPLALGCAELADLRIEIGELEAHPTHLRAGQKSTPPLR